MSEGILKEFIDDAADRMHKAVDAISHEMGTVRTGRASPALLDRVMVDYYGAQTPLRAARVDLRHRGAPADGHAVRQVVDQVDREGDPRGGPGADAGQRRQRDPPDDPRADRGAPQGAGQDRAQDRRGGPRVRPQRAPRRDARPARAEGGRRDRLGRRAPRRGRAAEADRPAHRRDRQLLHAKEAEVLEV